MSPISSSECKRGFSQMNLIVTPLRASLLTKTTLAVMFIRVVGHTLSQFDQRKFVESCLLFGHHSAIHTKKGEKLIQNLLKA
jgi:hypothetical protein